MPGSGTVSNSSASESESLALTRGGAAAGVSATGAAVRDGARTVTGPGPASRVTESAVAAHWHRGRHRDGGACR